MLKEGEVSVVSGQQSDELRTALEDVRERAVAAVARQEEAKEQAASLQQKTDKTLQACNLLKVCVCVSVHVVVHVGQSSGA